MKLENMPIFDRYGGSRCASAQRSINRLDPLAMAVDGELGGLGRSTPREFGPQIAVIDDCCDRSGDLVGFIGVDEESRIAGDLRERRRATPRPAACRAGWRDMDKPLTIAKLIPMSEMSREQFDRVLKVNGLPRVDEPSPPAGDIVPFRRGGLPRPQRPGGAASVAVQGLGNVGTPTSDYRAGRPGGVATDTA
jgi:hypothetical protein